MKIGSGAMVGELDSDTVAKAYSMSASAPAFH
jgi:hypothetical protein